MYRNTGGGWQRYTPGTGWTNAEHPGDSRLDHERAGRINGNWRSGAARSGGFHGGLGGMRPMGGGVLRRR